MYKEFKNIYDPDERRAEQIMFMAGERAILEVFAEECCELAQAALKYIRAAGLSNNPTPMEPSEVMANVVEELGDVLLGAYILGFEVDTGLMDWKLDRWEKRLKIKEDK